MHVVAYKRELDARHPELPGALLEVFEEARLVARRCWNDPNWSLLLWGTQELGRRSGVAEADPWANGLQTNHKNIEDFVSYSNEQELTRRPLKPEETICGDAPGRVRSRQTGGRLW